VSSDSWLTLRSDDVTGGADPNLSYMSEDDSAAISVDDGEEEVSEFGSEDGLEYEPDWDDDDILDQPMNVNRLSPEFFEMNAPDSEDSRL